MRQRRDANANALWRRSKTIVCDNLLLIGNETARKSVDATWNIHIQIESRIRRLAQEILVKTISKYDEVARTKRYYKEIAEMTLSPIKVMPMLPI